MFRGLGRAAPLMLGGILLAVYLGNARTIGSGDTLPARYLPFSILLRGTFYLDGLDGFDVPYLYYVRRVNGHIVSDYPVGSTILAAPMYLPFILAGVRADGPWPERLEKLAAATMVAASAALLFLALLRLVSPGWSVALAFVYGLCTSSLSVSSQALWQHTGSQLALAGTLYCVLRGRDEVAWAARSGFPMAFSVICRPTDGLLVAPIAVYVLAARRDWRFLWRFMAWTLPAVAFQAWYGAAYFRDPLRTQFPITGGAVNADFGEGLLGVLLSTGRGLFSYSPVFLLSVLGIALAWRRGGDGLLRAASVGIAPTIILYARGGFAGGAWSGGLSYGPRLLADLAPLLVALIAPAVPLLRRSRSALVASLFLALWLVAAHVYGLAPERGVYYRTDRIAEALWEWRHHPIMGWLVPRRETPERQPEPFFTDLRAIRRWRAFADQRHHLCPWRNSPLGARS